MTFHIDPRVIDPDTGLVKVPEGYYWEVRKYDSQYFPLEIVLRKRRWYWLDHRIMVYYGVFREPEGLLEACQNTVIRGNREQAAGESSVIGKYPPKRI